MDSVTLPLAFAAGVITFASPCFLPIVPVFLAYLAGDSSGAATSGAVGSGACASDIVSDATTTRSGTSARSALAGMPAVANLLVVERGRVSVAPQATWRPTRLGTGSETIIAPETGASTSTHTTSGTTMATAAGTTHPRARALVNALAFVASFSLVFVSMWAAVSLIGWVVGDLREPLRIVGGIVLILVGLFAMGVLRIPALERTRRLGGAPTSGRAPTIGRSTLLGLAFGAGWSPCIGPVLGMILGMALTRDTAVSGLALLVVFCAGLGLPFILMALGVSGLQTRVRALSRHFRRFQIVSGILMVAMGFLMIADLLAPLSAISWVKI
ncbi:MAG: cytochrome c biogenesis protein CcdA [Ancrocorticia sp.]